MPIRRPTAALAMLAVTAAVAVAGCGGKGAPATESSPAKGATTTAPTIKTGPHKRPSSPPSY